MVRKLILPFLLLLTFLPSPGASGQEPNQATSLEVFVSDKSGKRVTGLTREDFQVLEAGRPAEVTHFAAAGSGAAEPEAQRLQLVIVIDDLSLNTQSRGRFLKALREELVPRLQPQEVALVATSQGSAVEVVQGLTADKGLLLAALDRVEKSAPRGREGAMEGRRLRQEIQQAQLPNGSPTDLAEINAKVIYDGIRRYAERRADESRGTLAALTGFVDNLAGLPGRKSLLYVGGGLSLRPGEALYQAWDAKLGQLSGKAGASSLESFRNDLTAGFNALVQHANGTRVTVYTLGATEDLEQASLIDSLLRLADGTGGLSAVNVNDPGLLLAQMSDDFHSYYSLGFVPQGNREPRKIAVAVRGRSDLVVRSRSGQHERSGREQEMDRTMAALMLDPGQNPLEVALEFTRETKKAEGQLEVEMLVKFPLSHLVLQPSGDFHEGKVSIWVSTRDQSGRTSPVHATAVPIHVPNDQVLTALGQNAAYKMQLLLRPEEHRIAVAVHDELGHVDSAVSVPFKPGQ